MLNFEWYRTFKAIYQTGTLTGAAQELLISQPNVSQHLSSLEAYIGQQLFERKPRKMAPTEYGKLFYTQIIESVERLEKVETHFRHDCLCRQLPLTNIGAPKEFFHARLAGNISAMPAPIVMEFGVTRGLMQRLQKGELQFVFATQQTEEKHIVYEQVLGEQFLLVGNPALDTAVFDEYIAGNELNKAEQWLNALPWFAYSSDLMIIRRFWLENFRKRPSLRPQFIVPDFDAILKAIALGNGVTIATDYLVNDKLAQGQLKLIWKGAVETRNTIYLAYDRTKVSSGELEMVKGLFTPLP
ncbi:LysR family transcriptional regulator [Chitinophaga agrisoli]|uniref:LysR family transcriptional regulator n=1 Tax=Chitinophaga agrisoli TaxID=2607653 RepID=A0A5B2VRM4_9BACT|nr:LysR family transcriptional regulator [Chitinophaga agrisoli]KAA2240799.1 LysR family transcriptional regulator [Chitinophaga agrisoli]